MPSAHGPVLSVLARTTSPLTGRKVAELTSPHVSQARVSTILNDLVASGLVERTPAGSASLFTLNRAHLAAGAVAELADLRAGLWARLAQHAERWTHPPAAVVVYGSAARGDGDRTSDIDLLVVRPSGIDDENAAWQQDVTDLATQVTRWTGNPCEVMDRSTGELRSMATAGERLLADIRRDGRAVVGSLALVPAPAEA